MNHVRLEVEAALNDCPTVVPVLVDDIVMPAPEDLPESIRKIALLNASRMLDDPELRNSRNRLVTFLRQQRIGEPS